MQLRRRLDRCARGDGGGGVGQRRAQDMSSQPWPHGGVGEEKRVVALRSVTTCGTNQRSGLKRGLQGPVLESFPVIWLSLRVHIIPCSSVIQYFSQFGY